MKRHRRAGGAIIGVGLVFLGTLVAWTRPWERGRRVEFQPQPPGREALDLAVACIGAGEARPAVAQLTDGELDGIVTIIARLIAAYAQRDFQSFLALRAQDLEFAQGAQRGHSEELRSFCLELGLEPSGLPEDWVGLLRAYWRAYYVQAPVARFLPESSVIALNREGLGALTVSDWDAGFDALCTRSPGPSMQHRLVIPHRRSIERVAVDPAMRWLDLELGFEAHDGGSSRLVARFVWDGALQEWFLHRATTVFDGELRDDRRHLVL